MRTVKEFEDAGVVFVNGDKGEDFLVTKASVFNLHKIWSNCKVTSFAWRDITTKPDNAKFKIELDIANHRWRPSLNQGEQWPDEQRIDVIGQNGNDGTHYDNTTQQVEALSSDKPVKPVFTQAMADAGEVPPVGSEFILIGIRDTCLMSAIGINGFLYIHDGREFYSSLNMAEFKSILDTRTEEEKAVDEMLLLAIDSNDDIAKSIIYEACFKLYKAGYRKHADA